MTSQEINILLEFNSISGKITKFKIVKDIKSLIKTNEISLLNIEHEFDRTGNCEQCSGQLEFFLYEYNSKDDLILQSKTSNEDKLLDKIEVEPVHIEPPIFKEEIFVVENDEVQTTLNDEDKIEEPKTINNIRKNAKSKTLIKKSYKKKRLQDTIQKNEDGYWICPNCKSEFFSFPSLVQHRNVCTGQYIGKFHGGTNPKCSFCDRSFSGWSYVRRHERKEHLKTICFTCELCGYSTKYEQTLKHHKIKVHMGVAKPYMCDLCGFQCGTHGTILNHMKRKHLKRTHFMCEICSSKFISKGYLKTHMKSHIDERNFVCPLCNKKYKHDAGLRLHHYHVHEKKRYSCEKCEFVTHSKTSLRNHRGIHEKDRQEHFCNICKTGFGSKYTLRAHKTVHLDDRPFKCEHCEKTFKRKAELKIHTRYHTGEKPYECEICGQRYADRGCYRSHLIVHEKQLGIILDKSVKKFLKPDIVLN
uniref:CSON008861 protein n=1 Tax=Culicoides sonorensis TaxID=179676 RepID=A0A336MXH7_CULSO